MIGRWCLGGTAPCTVSSWTACCPCLRKGRPACVGEGGVFCPAEVKRMEME